MKKIFFIILVLLFTGCASKKELSNQTALFWHNKIYKNLSNMNLDGADDAFTSLEVEHPNSKYVPIDMLILYTAHYKNEEYDLAKFYINEYEKRYANRYEKEWCEYVKIKMDFLSIHNAYTNQKKIIDTLANINDVLEKYPNSIYNYEINTIKKKLTLTNLIFDNEISSLYKRLDKPKAAKLYKREINSTIIPPHIPWYKRLFYW
jgi:outer membrane protein assembly factor BamD